MVDNPALDPSLWDSALTAPSPQSNAAAKNSTTLAPAPTQRPTNPAMEPQVWQSPRQEQPPTPTFSGSVVPMTRYSDGSVGFDSNAGILGMAKRAGSGLWGGVTLPGDVATGKVDPNSPAAIRRSLDLASVAAPDAAVLIAKKVLTPPTAEALHAAEDIGYNAARDMDVRYSVPHVAEMARQQQAKLYADGFLPNIVPGTHKVLEDLQNVPDGATDVPLSALEAARRGLGNLRKVFTNPSEQAAARSAQNAIDDFVTNPNPTTVVSGPADQAAKVLTEARGNAATAFRSDRINKGEDTAELNAAAANSGQNVGNSIRQRAKAILLNPKLSQGYNTEELDALRDVVKGTTVSNSLRIVGNILGGGGGMHSFIAGGLSGVLGAEHLGPWGALASVATPLAGNMAKRADALLTAKRMEAADAKVRSRSPLFQEQQAAAPFELSASPGDTALVRAPVAGSAASSPDATSPQQPSPPTSKPSVKPVPKAMKGANAPPSMTPEEAARYVQTLRPGDTFARGGSVKRKTHEELVARLMDLSERAKNATKRDTKAILTVPDDTVAKALAIAQKAV